MSTEAGDRRPGAGPGAGAGARTGQRDAAASFPRRFYTAVTVEPAAAGLAVLLDGRALKTPRKAPLIVPNARLAGLVAAEWDAQGDRIVPATMPVTKLVNAAIDIVAPNMDAVRQEVVDYAMSDMLCYRAPAPADLVARQAAGWDPLVQWANVTLDAPLVTTVGIVHMPQPDAVRAAINAVVARLDALPLAAVNVATTLTGSAILGLAVHNGKLTAETAWDVAHIDEDHQIALWGDNGEALERRRLRWRDMNAVGCVLESLR